MRTPKFPIKEAELRTRVAKFWEYLTALHKELMTEASGNPWHKLNERQFVYDFLQALAVYGLVDASDWIPFNGKPRTAAKYYLRIAKVYSLMLVLTTNPRMKDTKPFALDLLLRFESDVLTGFPEGYKTSFWFENKESK